jgi:hypothetical protein
MTRQILQTFLIAICISLLTACATQAQKQAQNLVNQLKYAQTEALTCTATIEKSDVYKRADQFLIMKPNDPDAIKKMTIDRFATDSEKDDLLQVHSLASVCRKQMLENLEKAHPDYAALMASFAAQNDEILVHIMKSEITLGKANEAKNKLFPEVEIEWNAVSKNITQQLDNAHQYELQSRQRAAAAMQQWSYQQQVINSLNRPPAPVMTNCQQFGNSINCQSY